MAESPHCQLRVALVGAGHVNEVGGGGGEGVLVIRIPAVDRAVPINAAGRPVPAVAARRDGNAVDRGDGPDGGQDAPPDDVGIAEE